MIGEKVDPSRDDMTPSERARASEITVRSITAPPTGDERPEDKLRRLERKAKILRSRILQTIDVLDTRKQQVRVMGERAKQAASTLGTGLLTVAVVVGAGMYVIGRMVSSRVRRHRSLPDRLSNAVDELRPAPRPGLGRRLVEKLLLTVASIVAAEIAKRGSRNVLGLASVR